MVVQKGNFIDIQGYNVSSIFDRLYTRRKEKSTSYAVEPLPMNHCRKCLSRGEMRRRRAAKQARMAGSWRTHNLILCKADPGARCVPPVHPRFRYLWHEPRPARVDRRSGPMPRAAAKISPAKHYQSPSFLGAECRSVSRIFCAECREEDRVLLVPVGGSISDQISSSIRFDMVRNQRSWVQQ